MMWDLALNVAVGMKCIVLLWYTQGHYCILGDPCHHILTVDYTIDPLYYVCLITSIDMESSVSFNSY